MKLLIVGGAGFIGRELIREMAPFHEVICADKDEKSFSDFPTLHRKIDINDQPVSEYFDAVIFCASPNYKSDRSVLDQFFVGAQTWLEHFNQTKTRVIYLSTNHVFDGKFDRPALTHPYSPIDLYGEHKSQLERLVLKSPLNAVVRLTKVIGLQAPPFSQWLQSLEMNLSVEAFANFMIAPISVNYAANCVKQICEQKLNGIFHLSSIDEMSFADVLESFANHFGFNTKLIKKITADPRKYPRIGLSPNLDTTETCQRLNRLAPTVLMSIDQCLFPKNTNREPMVTT